MPVRMGHIWHTCVFTVAPTRWTARAGSGMLAAVSAQAVKESQTDLRFMVDIDEVQKILAVGILMPIFGMTLGCSLYDFGMLFGGESLSGGSL